jgi:hypothetical protein
MRKICIMLLRGIRLLLTLPPSFRHLRKSDTALKGTKPIIAKHRDGGLHRTMKERMFLTFLTSTGKNCED